MSHELRTPLNAILGFSDMIAQTPYGPLGDPRYSEYADDIGRSGRHLLDLINDILDLSKIEAGKFELRFDRIRVARVVDSAARFVDDSARAKDIALGVVISPENLTVMGDFTALVRVMINLLSNAVKFTPEGGRITVSAMVDDDTVRVAVEDTGIGIAAEDLERVFQPFQQAEGTYRRNHEGTGLGLAIVRSLAEAHGGSVTIDSTPGTGTTIALHFPLHDASTGSATEAA